jgi:hypothetical protein
MPMPDPLSSNSDPSDSLSSRRWRSLILYVIFAMVLPLVPLLIDQFIAIAHYLNKMEWIGDLGALTMGAFMYCVALGCGTKSKDNGAMAIVAVVCLMVSYFLEDKLHNEGIYVDGWNWALAWALIVLLAWFHFRERKVRHLTKGELFPGWKD